ncbi:MAG TPA: FIST N-terminal domain-containing protein [Actinomycetes bacterium]|jgi:small ligand-binding sensory domain FIST|nr:FIST N-terminal domain-containing protein [Actinomycetes bacterium]
MLTFGAAISTAPDHQQALDQVIPAALGQLGGAPDLVVCFFSMEHAGAAAGIALSLSERTGTSAILGCTAQGVIGDGRELEGEPGLAVWMARLPEVAVQPFALRVLPLEDGVGVSGWPDLAPEEGASVLLLADPFSFPADSFLERLNQEQPGLRVVGGMVSGATGPGRHRLLCGTDVLEGGAVGVALAGPVDIRVVVSQGCRPVGSPFAVTRGEGNVVHELGGRSAVDRLRQMLATLDQHEQELLRGGGLQVGQVIDEHKASFERGDFLVRGLLGADPETGSIAVADSVEVGQTLQFHVRDAAAADEDLELLLAPVSGWSPRGVLLFSCNGRGRGFFGEPDHDAARVASATGQAPMAGFFAQGELGPVGGRNFVHTFTASMAVFCEPRDPVPALHRAAAGVDTADAQPSAPETPEPV